MTKHKLSKREIFSNITLIVFNVIYCILGWFIFILFDITSPDDPKFDLDPGIRKLTFFLAFVIYFFCEVLFLKKLYRKVFNSSRKSFGIYIGITILLYLVPILVAVVEILFF